jgi:tetratricopeptide (TPR) repeat protein
VPTAPPPRPESTWSRYKGLVLVLVACLGVLVVGAAIYVGVTKEPRFPPPPIPIPERPVTHDEAAVSPREAAVPPRQAAVPPKDTTVVPKEAQDHLLRGIELAAQRDYDRAILAFSRAMVAHPPYAAAYANRGVAYIQKQEYPKALADLGKAVELDPRDKMAHYNLAALWSLANDKARALQFLDQAFRLGFDDVDAIRRDRDFDNIRNDPGFRQLLQRHSGR